MIKKNTVEGDIPVIAGGKNPACFHNVSNRSGNIITISASGANAGYVNYFPYPIFASDCITVQSKDEGILMTKFAYLYLRSIQGMIYDFQKGAGQPHVYSSDIASMDIPVPSIEEQKSIIQRLDKILELIALKEEVIEKIEGLTKAVYQKLFNDVGLSLTWPVVEIGKIILDVKNGITRRGEFSASGKIVLRLRDIRENTIDFSDFNRFELSPSESERFELSEGQLLFVRVNGNPDYVGRNCVFSGWNEKICYNDHIMRVSIDTEVCDPIYLSRTLNDSYGKSQIKKFIKTSAGQHTINQEGLSSVKIKLPPIPLQNTYSRFIRKQESLLSQTISSLKAIETLYNAVVQKSFLNGG